MATNKYRCALGNVIATDENGKEYNVGGIPDVTIVASITGHDTAYRNPASIEYNMKIPFWSRLRLKWRIRKSIRRLKKQVKELEKIGEPHELTISIKRGEKNGN